MMPLQLSGDCEVFPGIRDLAVLVPTSVFGSLPKVTGCVLTDGSFSDLHKASPFVKGGWELTV